MPFVYLALGSNLGNRQGYLQRALQEISSTGIKVLKVSSVIETDPVGGPNQGKYLNAVLKAQTSYSPEELLCAVSRIERRLGRVRELRNGPRVIDIDILLYDDLKLVTRRLVIPHPRMLERDFVMDPLKQIAPSLCESLER